MVLTLIAWTAITISLKRVFPTTSDLERGIAVPRFSSFNASVVAEMH